MDKLVIDMGLFLIVKLKSIIYAQIVLQVMYLKIII